MFGRNSKEEAMLYYLYMMADGDVSYNEEKLFDSICNELSLGNESKMDIIEKCKERGKESSDIFSIIIQDKVEEGAGNSWMGLRNSSHLARVIWNLVNLGYADSFYSDEEKKIVKYLVDKWSVKTEILQEFIDIDDTILALTKQKEWILTTFNKGTERDKREKKVDSQIAQMFEDVKITISEITM